MLKVNPERIQYLTQGIEELTSFVWHIRINGKGGINQQSIRQHLRIEAEPNKKN
jgi:hypothetical protein